MQHSHRLLTAGLTAMAVSSASGVMGGDFLEDQEKHERKLKASLHLAGLQGHFISGKERNRIAQHLRHGQGPDKELVKGKLRDIGVGRNDPCPCGSGKKFKKCCIGEIQ